MAYQHRLTPPWVTSGTQLDLHWFYLRNPTLLLKGFEETPVVKVQKVTLKDWFLIQGANNGCRLLYRFENNRQLALPHTIKWAQLRLKFSGSAVAHW